MEAGAVSLFSREDSLSQATVLLSARGYRIHGIDCGSWAAFVAGLAREFEWQAMFGYEPIPERLNLDAIDDAVRSLSFGEETGRVVILRTFDRLLVEDERRAKTILDIIANASRHHMLFGNRFFALCHLEDPDADVGEIGGQRPAWNTFEWAERGLK